MKSATKTLSNNQPYFYEDGERIYPCICGKTHRGQYAVNEYRYHNCLHETDLLVIGNSQAICPDCGMAWRLEKV